MLNFKIPIKLPQIIESKILKVAHQAFQVELALLAAATTDFIDQQEVVVFCARLDVNVVFSLLHQHVVNA